MNHVDCDVTVNVQYTQKTKNHNNRARPNRPSKARRGISCTFYCTFPALFLHFFSTRTARQTIFFLREQRAAAAATQFVHSSFKQHNGINTTTHHTLVSICLLLRNSLYLFTVFISGYWTHTLKQSFDTVDVLDRKRDGF